MTLGEVELVHLGIRPPDLAPEKCHERRRIVGDEFAAAFLEHLLELFQRDTGFEGGPDWILAHRDEVSEQIGDGTAGHRRRHFGPLGGLWRSDAGCLVRLIQKKSQCIAVIDLRRLLQFRDGFFVSFEPEEHRSETGPAAKIERHDLDVFAKRGNGLVVPAEVIKSGAEGGIRGPVIGIELDDLVECLDRLLHFSVTEVGQAERVPGRDGLRIRLHCLQSETRGIRKVGSAQAR